MSDDALNLLDLFPEDERDRLTGNPHFCGYDYTRWEDEIATPALIALGYSVRQWWSADGDSFGPLVRAVEVVKDGVKKTYTYG